MENSTVKDRFTINQIDNQGGNREMNKLYTTSQVSAQFLYPTKLLIIGIFLDISAYLTVK